MAQVESPVLLFDGVCNLCNATVNFVIDADREGRIRFASLQSAAGARLLGDVGLNTQYLDSLVFIEGGRAFVASDGAVRIARYLGWPWRALRVFEWVPRVLREPVYHWVARNRYRWFGRQESCRMPTDELAARFVDDPA